MRKLAAVVLTLASSTAQAAGEPPAKVALALQLCERPLFDRSALLSLLAIELRSDGVGQVGEDPTDAAATLRVEQPDCEQKRVLLLIEDRLTGKTVGRSVELGAVDASARARFLALSGAELLRASWLELLALRPSAEDPLVKAVRARALPLVAPSPSVTTPEPPPPPPPPPPAPEPGVAWQLGLLGRSYPSSQGGMLGGWVGAWIPWGERTSVRLEGRISRGEAFDPLGTVALLQGSGAAALLLSTAAGGVRLSAGPQVEVGAGRVRGEAASEGVSARSGIRGLASVGALGQLTGAAGPVGLVGSAELGATVAGLSAQADGRRVVGLQGVYLGAALGVSWGR